MPSSHDSLTDVLRLIIKKAPSGKSATLIAELLGKPYTTLMNELNPEQPGHKLGVELLLPIMELADSDEPLAYLAERRGGVFIKLPKADAGAEERLLVKTIKEFGELAGAAGEALDNDGVIDAEERETILREGQEALTAIQTFLTMVEGLEP